MMGSENGFSCAGLRLIFLDWFGCSLLGCFVVLLVGRSGKDASLVGFGMVCVGLLRFQSRGPDRLSSFVKDVMAGEVFLYQSYDCSPVRVAYVAASSTFCACGALTQ